ncbi:MAG: hypothetical protein HN348_25700, partial [Proteobacteria bacterium]|nr:hypothetical protein [Pseudomonadota bacterium]
CPFTQPLPWMIGEGEDLIVPNLRLDQSRQLINPQEIIERLGLSPAQGELALQTGLEGLNRWQARVRAMGAEIIKENHDRIVVVMGRSYNLGDPFLNMNLGQHLKRLGLAMMPMDALPLHEVELDSSWDSLVWSSNRDYIRASMLICRDPRLFPVVLSSFGCGPDGFTVKYLESLLESRPRLFLELDEHRGEAGFVTRLEAFADEIDAHLRRKPPTQPPTNLKSSETGFPPRNARIVVPRFADHAYAFVGALRRSGWEVTVLPPPDQTCLLLGESLSSGRECHPFTILAGDLAGAVQKGLLRPGDAFFFPGGVNACLYSQYPAGLRHVLHRMGAKDISIVSPNVVEMRDNMGYRTGIDMWQGTVAADLMLRVSCELRPYERHKGEIDRIHQTNLEQLADAVEEGRVLDFLPNALTQLQSVERIEGPRRPIIGVAGDVYTRINAFASGDLFARLEELGCEVWPAPFLVDSAEFNLTHCFRKALHELDIGEMFTRGIIRSAKDFGSWRLRRCLPEWSHHYQEPDYDHVMAMAASYVGPGADPIVILNLAKMVDFAQRGAAGVLNAICFGCMVGGVSAAIMERIRQDHDDIPMSTLTFGGTEGSDDNARLEAFVYQAQRYHQQRHLHQETHST